MTSSLPLLLVEDPPEKQFADALFRSYPVEIASGGTTSATIGTAEGSLMLHPERPVAVLFNANTTSPREIAELRGAARRLLARASPLGWWVALAIPRLDAWAMTDPRIKQDFESYLDGKASYRERAARFVELTKKVPFDDTVLCAENQDYRDLVDFLKRHAPAAKPQPSAAC